MTKTNPSRLAVLLLPLPMLLAGCAEPVEDRPDVEQAAIPVQSDAFKALGDAGDSTIPVALHGRWTTPNGNCADEGGVAEGDLEISGSQLRFTDSTAELGSVLQDSDNGLRATFSFAGEGEEWRRDIQLSLNEEGTEMTRTEFGEDALTKPLTYTKCDV